MAENAEERERVVVKRLRAAVMGVVACGALAAAAGYANGLVVTSGDQAQHVVPAGGDALALYLVAMLLPAGVAMRRPRWPQVVLWILWAFPCTLLALLVEIEPYRRTETLQLLWPAWLVYGLVALMWLGLLVVIPLVRSTHHSPPLRRRASLPAARVWR